MIPMTKFEDDYFIDRDTILGKGQYGVVYPCSPRRDRSKKLCVKIINNTKAGGEQKLIDREIEILRSLTNTNNPYLVRLEQIYDENDQIKIVMEMCDYGDLQKLIREKQQKNEKFTAGEVLTFVGSMVNGYYELYNRNIIHRDLKPANILIQNTPDGYIYKISDFGMSRVIEDVRKRLRLSKVGSPAYAAPQLFLEDTFSTKADVYSLGVIIYQMVFQRFPFDGFNIKDIHNFFHQLQIKPFECPEIPLEGGLFEKSRIKGLIENMITRDENNRMDWEKLFATFKKQDNEVYKYKPKVRIISVTENKNPIIDKPQFAQQNIQQSFIEHVTVPCHDFQRSGTELEGIQKILALNLQKYSFAEKLKQEILKTDLDKIQIPLEIRHLYCALIHLYQKCLMNLNKDILFDDGNGNESSFNYFFNNQTRLGRQVLSTLRNSNERSINYLREQSCKNYQECEINFITEYNTLCSFSQSQLEQLPPNLREIYKEIKYQRAQKLENLIQAMEYVYKEGQIKTQLESNQDQQDYTMIYYLLEKMLRLDKKYPVAEYQNVELVDVDHLPGNQKLLGEAISKL